MHSKFCKISITVCSRESFDSRAIGAGITGDCKLKVKATQEMEAPFTQGTEKYECEELLMDNTGFRMCRCFRDWR